MRNGEAEGGEREKDKKSMCACMRARAHARTLIYELRSCYKIEAFRLVELLS